MENNVQSWQEELEEVKRLYEVLLKMVTEQRRLIEPEDELSWPIDEVLELHNKCQTLMEEIDKIDYSKNRVSPVNNPLPPGELAIYINKVEQINKIILKIETINHSCQIKLELARQKISSKLNQTRENKKAQLAYDQRDVYTSAWFFDKKQ